MFAKNLKQIEHNYNKPHMSENSFLIYVVEDNEWYNKLLVHTLSLNPDYEIVSFKNGKDALKELEREPDLVTVDYRLPDLNGFDIIDAIKADSPSTEVIVISEQEEIETAIGLMREGAYDYLVKSKDIRDRLLKTVEHIRQNLGLRREVQKLQKEVKQKYTFKNSIIGNSQQMQRVFEMTQKALNNNISVMINGETGTGKEVVAKAIHFNSNRQSKPFVAVNVAAIPAELFESELFGHEKGAFTGANSRRIGKFEEADGGTLFLDEIGEMDINFQAKLLRALQEKEIVRIGSNQPVKTNCRIIVATNRDLLTEVKNGNFRQDLYYRLIGLPIVLPPLRERDNDVLLLAHSFIQSFCKENEMPLKPLSETAKNKLMTYTWPGNVRELKSVIELAVVLANSEKISADDISIGNPNDALPDVMGEEMTMREYKQRIVLRYMERYNNDTKLIAEKLAIGQTTVYRLLNEVNDK